MAARERTTVTVEEYIERRTESAAGRTVERHYRRAHLQPAPERATVLQVMDTAAPLLRAVAIAMAPAVGRMALRALAPTGSEAPFAVTQVLMLMIFAALTVAAAKLFRPAPPTKTYA